MIEAGSMTPYRQFVFESPEYVDQYAVIKATGEVASGGGVMALSLTDKYVEMQQVFFEQMTAAFTDQKTPEEAFEQAATEIDAILAE
jgi:ABC-type glycerol-3-phosphate transport system substrate-binding protein